MYLTYSIWLTGRVSVIHAYSATFLYGCICPHMAPITQLFRESFFVVGAVVPLYNRLEFSLTFGKLWICSHGFGSLTLTLQSTAFRLLLLYPTVVLASFPLTCGGQGFLFRFLVFLFLNWLKHLIYDFQ